MKTIGERQNMDMFEFIQLDQSPVEQAMAAAGADGFAAGKSFNC